ncbi:MAG TPA: hypothetical protein VEG61_08340, partial [Candidatus Dormibacteraeota bacterium]|nr:hypothetical protein [Candidatus Dormibacteraeota bacterium]
TREIDIASQYEAAGWQMPESISFTLILGTTWLHPGNWVGYFSGLSVDVAPLQTQSLSPTQTLTVLIFDAVIIMLLGILVVSYGKRKKGERAGKQVK